MNRRSFNLAAILAFFGFTSSVKAKPNFPVARFQDGNFVNREELMQDAKWVLKQPQPHTILEKEIEVWVNREDALLFNRYESSLGFIDDELVRAK